MFKGILALFKSGIIFNPMVLLGILSGFIAMGTMDDERLHAFYTNYHLYLLMLLVAVMYVFFFKRTYYRGGLETNWKETIQTMVGYFLMLVVSFIFSMLFITVISFGGSDEENYDLPEFDQVQQELKKNQETLQQNYEAILKAVDAPVPEAVSEAKPTAKP